MDETKTTQVRTMAQVSKEFIISALRAGFAEVQIAEALNVTVSAVEQLINAHGLRDLAARNSKFESIDNKLNNLEEKILDKLEKVLPFANKPETVTKMLTAVNGAKRRSLAEGRTLQDNSVRLVQINLPERVQHKVALNSQNQVVGIDDRELITAPSGQVLERVRQENRNALEQKSKAAQIADHL